MRVGDAAILRTFRAKVSAVFRVPPLLRPGSSIRVVAPASGFPRDELFRGLGFLAGRYRIAMREGAFAREGYLAGDDARRLDELTHAMLDPEVEAIFCARGGYGITRIVDALPWDAFARAPKWIVGFSDVTALHLRCARLGIASVHAPNVTGLARTSPLEKSRLMGILERAAGQVFEGLDVVHPGAAARGPAVGGNLALLECEASASALRFPDGAVLVLEDVTERPYRLDRMLTSLARGGHLASLAAIVIGDMTECSPGPDGVTADEVLAERTAHLGKLVVRGLPVGHGVRNMPIPLGFFACVAPSGRVEITAP